MRQETDSKRKGLSWILAGVGIELFGALLIWQSLPDFGVRTIPGLVCVVLGSLVMTWGLVKRAQKTNLAWRRPPQSRIGRLNPSCKRRLHAPCA